MTKSGCLAAYYLSPLGGSDWLLALLLLLCCCQSVRVQPKEGHQGKEKKKSMEKRQRKSDERMDRTDNGGTEFRGEQKA